MTRPLGAVLGRRSIAVQVLILQVVVLIVVASSAGTALVLMARHTAGQNAAGRVLAVAETFAEAPGTRDALRAPAPSDVLQPIAEATRRRAGVDFLVVMTTTGVRYTHPDPRLIGRHFIGHIDPAVRGQEFTETFTGTLGPSVRAVVPVLAPDGSVSGLVSAGITLKSVDRSVTRQILVVLIASIAMVVLTLGGVVLLSLRVRRQTRGLGSDEIARMYEHHDAVLHAVREGVLIIDGTGRLLLANDEARRLLNLPADGAGLSVDEVGLAPAVAGLFGSGRPITDTVLPVGDRLLAVNQRPTSPGDRTMGSVVTLRDTTELRALTGELAAVREFAAALRAQTHEAANRMHTVVTLVQLERYAQAVAFATDGLAGSQRLTDQLLAAVDEPVLAALLLGKIAQAHERGVELVVTEDTRFESFGIDAADLVTLVGNLVDNAIDAALTDDPDPDADAGCDPGSDPGCDADAGAAPPGWIGGGGARRARRVTVTVRADQDTCTVRVADTGPGLPPDQLANAFRAGWTTKHDATGSVSGRGIGLALVRQVVRRYAGSVTVGRDGGTVFTVRLSPHRPPAADEPDLPPSGA